VMQREGQALSALAKCFEPFPQALVNVVVREKRPIAELPGVAKSIAAAEKALGDEGRVLVRFSGTENKVRVLVEGPDAKRIRALAEGIAGELKAAIG
jgi:phosphoglucosamine mutase